MFRLPCPLPLEARRIRAQHELRHGCGPNPGALAGALQHRWPRQRGRLWTTADYALLNDWSYQPRSVFQSYVACNTRLMRLNEQFYLSPKAPQYVLFGLGNVTRKFPPLEDAMVLRDLLINYVPAGEEAGFLLLKHQCSGPPRLTLLREGAVRVGARIDLRGSGNTNLWLEISMPPTLLAG